LSEKKTLRSQPVIQQYESTVKKKFCNQSSHHQNYGQFPLQMEVITCIIPQNGHFVVSKDEWDAKKGVGKSIKNALYE